MQGASHPVKWTIVHHVAVLPEGIVSEPAFAEASAGKASHVA